MTTPLADRIRSVAHAKTADATSDATVTITLDGVETPILVRCKIALGSADQLLEEPLRIGDDICLALNATVIADGRKSTKDGIVHVATLEPGTVRLITAATLARLLQGTL